MRFTKDSLSFLGVYAKCADTKQAQNDKFQIKTSVDDQTATFSQFSANAIVITTLKAEIKEDFTGVYPIGQFLALIQSIPSSEYIDIKSDGVYFKSNRYEFEKFNFEDAFKDTEKFIELINGEGKSITISQFSKTTKSLIGPDDLEFVLALNGNFVSAISGDTITCSYKTDNPSDITFYIPKLAVTLCNEAKLESVVFSQRVLDDQTFYFTNIGSTYIIFMNKEYNTDIAKLFTDELRCMYDHDTMIVINKTVLKGALDRIKVFSAKSIYSRVYCSSTNNQFKIESKEQNSGYAIELIDAKLDDALKDQEKLFCASQAYLSTILSFLKGEMVVIHSDAYSPDGVAIKVTDEIGDDFFILCFIPE